MATYNITQDELKSILHYDPETGIFTWLVDRPNTKAGKKAGCSANQRYERIYIHGSPCASHHLAWLYMYGRLPLDRIDHINRNSLDNRICNLRECTQAQNCQNASTYKNNVLGIKGVGWHKAQNKWRARITINKKVIELGYFTSLTSAIDARKQAEKLYHTFRCT